MVNQNDSLWLYRTIKWAVHYGKQRGHYVLWSLVAFVITNTVKSLDLWGLWTIYNRLLSNSETRNSCLDFPKVQYMYSWTSLGGPYFFRLKNGHFEPKTWFEVIMADTYISNQLKLYHFSIWNGQYYNLSNLQGFTHAIKYMQLWDSNEKGGTCFHLSINQAYSSDHFHLPGSSKPLDMWSQFTTLDVTVSYLRGWTLYS